ncbi:MAG: tetratricopeptide repeat protein, partial [Duncaniella sp.]|nr:tetratricopeptide repeat protein [Duncaniella sp.]
YHMACDRRNLEKALRMAEKACQLSVDNPTNIDTYAWVLYQLGRWEEARAQIDRAIELTGENPDESGAELLDHAGDIYFRLGEREKALEFWRKALGLEPGSETIRQKIKDKGLPKAD